MYRSTHKMLILLWLLLLVSSSGVALAQAEKDEPMRFMIRHYKVIGTTKIPRIKVEAAVYPFMGPACSEVEVEKARRSLEKAYHEEGYKTVSVTIPPQDVSKGYVKLQVIEGKVQRLRVRGSRYFDPDAIVSRARSLSEGQVPNFNDVTREIVSLNRNPDRIVLPQLKPTERPGEFDVDLKVKDRLPLHGNLEVNNRNSPNTTETRLNLGLSYANLWQKGHTIGASMQIAPERTEDGLVYSGYYIMPLSESGVNLMLMGTKQDSDISTLGGAAVKGKGHVIGARLNIPLPGSAYWKAGSDPDEPPQWTPNNFFHTLSLGIDYKHFTEDLQLGQNTRFTPIDYFPVSISYGAGWIEKKHTTNLNLIATAGIRGLGSSDSLEFDNKRYLATGGFFTLKGDLSHTRDLPGNLQFTGKVQGQWASQPLINNEQFSGGGLSNTRGYLESSVLGDNALFGTLELSTPNLIKVRQPSSPETTEEPTLENKTKEWRIHAFVDGGVLTLNQPLPEQDDYFELLSVGLGTRFNYKQKLQGSLDFGLPLIKAGEIQEGDWRVTYRMWTSF